MVVATAFSGYKGRVGVGWVFSRSYLRNVAEKVLGIVDVLKELFGFIVSYTDTVKELKVLTPEVVDEILVVVAKEQTLI